MTSSKQKQTKTKEKFTPKLELTEEEQTNIKETLELFDPNGTNCLKTNELKVILRALGIERRKERLKKIISSIDPDGTGKITFEEFSQMIAFETSKNDRILNLFRLFDYNNTGVITYKKLKRVSKRIGKKFTDKQLKGMIYIADRNRDGKICKEEFVHILKKTCSH